MPGLRELTRIFFEPTPSRRQRDGVHSALGCRVDHASRLDDRGDYRANVDNASVCLSKVRHCFMRGLCKDALHVRGIRKIA